MRITLILASSNDGWGGMEKHVVDLAEELSRMKHEVHVLAHPKYQSHFLSVQFHPCPMQLGRRNPWLRWQISRSLAAVNPDVVHAHGSKAAWLLSKIRTKRWQTVGTIHGTKSNWKAFEPLNKVIAVSDSIYAQVSHLNRFLVYNGAKQMHSRKQLDRKPSAASNKVIAVGRLEPVKGFDLLIQAWPIVLAVDPQAELTIYGEGSQRANLEKLVQAPALKNSIKLAGHVDLIAEHIQKADLLVISSRREGFPYTLVEALLADCPVISTPVSGSVSLLPTEAITPDFSVASLGKKLVQAVTHLESLRRDCIPSFEFARANLTVEKMAAKTLKVYEA